MDQQTDITHKTLYRILEERPGVQDLIKQASVGQKLDHLPNSAFADDVGRNFPIDTQANAAMSLAYATKTANLEDRVARRLGDAADLYGIMLPPKQQVKVAQEIPRYLLPKQQKFGIKVASDVPKAEAALLRVASKLGTEDLATASTVLVKAANDAGMEVSDRVMQWAGLSQCDTEKTAEWLEARESASMANGAYTKLASVVRHLDSSNSRSDLVKIAETIGKLDEIYDLQKHYGRKLPNPLETVFSTKTAMEKTIELAGEDVPLKDLLKKGRGFFEDTLGKDLADEISTEGKLDETKLVRELPILPADMLRPMLNRMGIKVKKKVTKEAGAQEEGSVVLPAAAGLGASALGVNILSDVATKRRMLDKIQRIGDTAHARKAMNHPLYRYGGLGKGNLKDILGSDGKSKLNKLRGIGGVMGAGALASGAYLLNKAYNNYENS